MRIAFYAPLKPPDHPTPSGDRKVARLLIAALRLAGHEVTLASRLRSYDGSGDVLAQFEIAARGKRTAASLVRRWRDNPAAPELWFTYHLYYKAPDHLGPAVCNALGIRYVVAEASFAAKRANGAWATNHAAVERALRRADRVIGLNSADRDGVLPLLASPRRWTALPPFLDTARYRPSPRDPDRAPRLVTVAMMRPGDKLDSYRQLGAALTRLRSLAWTLDIIGDGPAREDVAAAKAPLEERISWLGALSDEAVAECLGAADLYVWPAVNEAYGMALLEAQASGLPVVAGRSGGVADIVEHGVTGLLVPPGDIAAFAEAVRLLIDQPRRRAAMGEAALRKVRRDHDLAAAAAQLGAALA